MSQGTHCLALDFGASCIRLVAVALCDGRLQLHEFARFAHAPRKVSAQWVWDYGAIYREIETALTTAAAAGRPYASIGVDSWGVDYVLLDRCGDILGAPVSYRDPRTDGQIAAFAAGHIPAQTLFEKTGIPALFFNTLYQLFAQGQREPEPLRAAERLLFTADYAHFWLSGVAANEVSLSSTSQMLGLDGNWWEEATATLGLNPSVLAKPVAAGTRLGTLTPDLQGKTGLGPLAVIAPCSHDTQSAILGVPACGSDDWAYLSSGTWSILGAESDRPFCNAAAAEAGLGNEQGYGGKYCVQSTVTGLWLIQEIQRLLEIPDPWVLAEQAEAAEGFRSLINPADERFTHPADMIAEIRVACREADEPVPQTLGELARCAYDSLALLYRHRLAVLSEIAGRRFARLHVVGGGSQAMLLNHLCASVTGLEVLAGPAEATAIGNGLVQLIALGAIKDVASARALVRQSFPPKIVMPAALPGLDGAVARFDRLSTPKRL